MRRVCALFTVGRALRPTVLIRYAPIFSFRLELFSACRHNNSLSIKTLWRHNWERRLAVRGSGSPDSVHVDSHMRCLLFKKALSNQYIFIRIEMLFISDFNAFTLCKFWAYFALNRFSWVITLCERRGAQIAYSADRVNRNIVVKFSLVGTIVFTLFGRFSQGQQKKEKTHRFCRHCRHALIVYSLAEEKGRHVQRVHFVTHRLLIS